MHNWYERKTKDVTLNDICDDDNIINDGILELYNCLNFINYWIWGCLTSFLLEVN